jgi:putative restriction endonuclease
MAVRRHALPILRSSRATYDDLIAAPRNLIAEIVDGRLYGTPRPPLLLSMVASLLGGILHGGRDHWWILRKAEIHLHGDVLAPDLSGWRRDRLPRIPDVPWMSVVPDWACEVMTSPSNERLDREVKLPVYAREGVACVWLVKPLTRALEVYWRGGSRWSLIDEHRGDEMIRVEPFDDIEWELGRLWADQDPD